MIENEKINPTVKENAQHVLNELKINRQTLADEIGLSIRTVDRIMNGYATEKTIKLLVNYYNQHGNLLYPHHVDEDLFQNSRLSTFIEPTWNNEQVAGEYVGLYLSRRGTGKPKAMALKIFENQNHLLEAYAIDTVHDLDKISDLMQDVFSDNDLEQTRLKYEIAKDEKKSLLRGSRFLHGKLSGCRDLMFMSLTDDQGVYEVKIATSLKSYINTYNKVSEKYNMRGGAVLATVYDLEDWPYSMIIGLIRNDYWHPEMPREEITHVLQRMHSYQKKENMVCLQNDIDALFYEFFVDFHRQSEEKV